MAVCKYCTVFFLSHKCLLPVEGLFNSGWLVINSKRPINMYSASQNYCYLMCKHPLTCKWYPFHVTLSRVVGCTVQYFINTFERCCSCSCIFIEVLSRVSLYTWWHYTSYVQHRKYSHFSNVMRLTNKFLYNEVVFIKSMFTLHKNFVLICI